MGTTIVDRAVAIGLRVDMQVRCCAAHPTRYRFSWGGHTVTGWLTPEVARAWLDGAAHAKEAMTWQTGDMTSPRARN